MSLVRVRPHKAEPGTAAPEESSKSLPVWVSRFTSPAAVLIAVPGLVALVGLALTLSSVHHISELARANAVSSANDRARGAERSIQRTLLQADVLLERAVEFVHSRPKAEEAELAYAFRDLALDRKGLKWLSVSLPDGTFRGVYVDRDGQLRYQVSRLVAERTAMTQFDFTRGGGLVHHAHADFSYDPRTREFYREAVTQRRRIWTKPYPFYPDFRTGITRAEALFDGDTLRAVVTVDYDIAELSGVLNGEADPGTPMVMFDASGAVLALASVGPEFLPKQAPRERALSTNDLHHPALAAFFKGRGKGAQQNRELDADGEDFIAVEHSLSAGPELSWRFAVLFDEQRLFRAARQQSLQGLLVSALVLLIGTSLAIVLARGIHRLRFAKAAAEAREQQALAHARELGSYQLESLLGAGGMGEVWRARHRLLARPAAIKLIRPDLPGVEAGRLEARFEREAQLLSQLRSPHTVSVLDFGRTTDGRLFLVMELLDGLALDQLVERHGPQPAARVIPMLIGICESLAEAHAAGLVHRDIKPANVFLCHEGESRERVKVLDFGLAKIARGPGLTAEGAIAGTPDYMAPEQARGVEIDGRADLYAVGCTAWFLLTGKVVFTEQTAMGTILAHQLKPVPDFASACTQWLPAELELLVTRCLSKDPDFRPRSAASIARALRDIVIPQEHRYTGETARRWWERVSDAPPKERAERSSVSEVSVERLSREVDATSVSRSGDSAEVQLKAN